MRSDEMVRKKAGCEPTKSIGWGSVKLKAVPYACQSTPPELD